MNLLIRVLLYVPILYLIMIVYVGQRHDNARDTLRGAGKLTVKGLLYTAILVLIMESLEWLFID